MAPSCCSHTDYFSSSIIGIVVVAPIIDFWTLLWLCEGPFFLVAAFLAAFLGALLARAFLAAAARARGMISSFVFDCEGPLDGE